MLTTFRSRFPGMVLVIVLILIPAMPAFGQEHRCAQELLDGLYVFSATGFVTPPGAAAIPKAIVELIRFNGDGTATVPALTLTVNNTVTPPTFGAPGSPGVYTVSALAQPDGICLGTLTFTSSGNAFNLFIPLRAEKIWMIQTNFNDPAGRIGNVFQGMANKIAR